MNKQSGIVALFVFLVAAFWVGPSPVAADRPPAVSGWMEQFSFIDPPRPAPQTPFQVGDGREVTLADFRGNVMLVNFWATWCAPCVRELPSLDRLQARLGGEGLLVLAINQDRRAAEVAGPFLKKLGVDQLVVFLDERMRLGRAFGVAGLPWSFLIDRDGNVVGELVGYTKWDTPEGLALIRHYMDRKKSPPVLEKSGN